MDENEVWRAFGGHPEGLNAAEVEKSAQYMATTKFRRKSLPLVGSPVGLLPQPVQPAADGAGHYLLRH
jgi:hypothetical protein